MAIVNGVLCTTRLLKGTFQAWILKYLETSSFYGKNTKNRR